MGAGATALSAISRWEPTTVVYVRGHTVFERVIHEVFPTPPAQAGLEAEVHNVTKFESNCKNGVLARLFQSHNVEISVTIAGNARVHKCERAWTAYCEVVGTCLLYTSPSPRDGLLSRMPSSA